MGKIDKNELNEYFALFCCLILPFLGLTMLVVSALYGSWQGFFIGLVLVIAPLVLVWTVISIRDSTEAKHEKQT